MNGIWQQMIQDRVMGTFPSDLMLPSHILAQIEESFSNFDLNLVQANLWDIGRAVAILIIGTIAAWAISAFIGGLLKKTDIDNKIAGWVTGSGAGQKLPPVENWISTVIFWLIMIFVLVAFFNQLGLTAVSEPLNTFLNQIAGFLPQLAGALLWLGIAWLVATAVKLAVSRLLRALRLDERLNRQAGNTPGTGQIQLTDTLANALYWFIFLLFLPPVLEALGLEQALQPVQNMLDEILAALPNILKAVIIVAAGWLIATVVRRIVANLLAATGTDRLGLRFGISSSTGGQSLSSIISTVVYVLVLIPFAISALEALEIESISVPAVAMLQEVLQAIPDIFTAGLILVVAYVIGRFVSDLLTNILTGIGFNNIFNWLGLPSTPGPRVPAPPSPDPNATVLQDEGTNRPPSPGRTPSEIVGIVALVGIMLFATVTATDILGLEALTLIVNQVLLIAGQVLLGVVVFAIGLYFANLAFSLIDSPGSRQARFLAQTARVGIIILVSAMALQQMGIASDIVNLAFGLLLGAIAVAIALSFGLGGRDIASEQIREWLNSFKAKK
ncbi:MAG: mechanosensitive ion channel [Cyanobacteriota bacterium]|nr:mechanosensitive ion channel [Cyanobacteriota bacterium]